MKKLIIFALFGLSLQKGFGQIISLPKTIDIEIGRNNRMSNEASLHYSITGGDTTIDFHYWNAEYEHIKDYKVISLKGGQKEVDQLYNILIGFFDDNSDKDGGFVLGDKTILVAKDKILGVKCISIRAIDGHTKFFAKKEINKIFDK